MSARCLAVPAVREEKCRDNVYGKKKIKKEKGKRRRCTFPAIHIAAQQMRFYIYLRKSQRRSVTEDGIVGIPGIHERSSTRSRIHLAATTARSCRKIRDLPFCINNVVTLETTVPAITGVRVLHRKIHSHLEGDTTLVQCAARCFITALWRVR